MTCRFHSGTYCTTTVSTWWSADTRLWAVQGWTPALSSKRSQAGTRELLEDRDSGSVQLCTAGLLPLGAKARVTSAQGFPSRNDFLNMQSSMCRHIQKKLLKLHVRDYKDVPRHPCFVNELNGGAEQQI